MKLYIKIPLIIINLLFVLLLLGIEFLISDQLYSLMSYLLGIFTFASIWILIKLFKSKSKKKSVVENKSSINSQEGKIIEEDFHPKNDKPQPSQENLSPISFTSLPDNFPKKNGWEKNNEGYLELK